MADTRIPINIRAPYPLLKKARDLAPNGNFSALMEEILWDYVEGNTALPEVLNIATKTTSASVPLSLVHEFRTKVSSEGRSVDETLRLLIQKRVEEQ